MAIPLDIAFTTYLGLVTLARWCLKILILVRLFQLGVIEHVLHQRLCH